MQSSFFDQFISDPVDPHAVSPIGTVSTRDCREAGKKAIAPHIGELHERVMGALRLMGAMSDQEIADFLGIDRTTAIPRRTELMQLGKVRKAGAKRNAKTGVTNITYELT